MLITKEYLKSLNPCEDRYRHYLDHYKDWSGSLEEFLDLSELTHEDKKWVFFRSFDKSKMRLVAADFAGRVLHVYESKYPKDDRPRKSIEEARSGKDIAAVADAAYAAVRAADAYATAADAYATADAAYAAAAAAYAAYAAAYADAYAADVADAAAYADAYAADVADAEEKAQIEIMKKYAREALKESDEKT